MATLLIFPVVKGYQKYQLKCSTSSSERPAKSKRNRKSITSLVIPSVTSAHFPVLEAKRDHVDWSQYDEKILEDRISYSAPNPPYTIPAPSRAPPTPPEDAESNLARKESSHLLRPFEASVPRSMVAPERAAPSPLVMLGIPFCDSPGTPPVELQGDAPDYFSRVSCVELPSDSPVSSPGDSGVFKLDGDEGGQLAPLSPAPLSVAKRNPRPIPELTFSLCGSESEGEDEDVRSPVGCEMPDTVEVFLLDVEPPPIPSKSPARRLRIPSS